MIKHIATLFKNFPSSLKYLFNFEHTKYQFKLIDIIYSETHNHKICHIHSSGKNIFFKLPAREIINNPALLYGFSQEDIVSIARLDSELEYISKVHPISIKEIILSSEYTIEPTIILSELGKHNLRRLSLSAISSNDEIMSSFKKHDIYKIGYLTGAFNERKITHEKQIAKQQYTESINTKKPKLCLVS